MITDLSLTLMMGAGVPVPAPRAVIDALQSVKVESRATGDASGFELTFAVEKNSPLISLFMLSGAAPIPMFRVLLIVTLSGRREALIDGIATQTQAAPATGGGPATLIVQGKDMTGAMDVIPFDGLPYPAMPPFARVLLILAKYAFLGVLPKVIPSTEGAPSPTDRIARQQGTDLHYLRLLAKHAGYMFRMQPGPAIGTSFAYWGPEIHAGRPQPALTVDSGAADNVESLSFRFDKDGTTLPIVMIHTKKGAVIPIPIPSSIPFLPPLGLVSPLPPSIALLNEAGNLKPVEALARGLAFSAQNSAALTGSGTLDVLRYGRPLKAGLTVGVRGAGLAFDGLHFVESVTSNLTPKSFKQDFSLSRNGLLPTIPRVSV
ncbi:MAG: hypothetical protein QOG13_314 [Sphingomonadales bacterium]|nr:hypothetical protein [Sphingomonadales bacterium]